MDEGILEAIDHALAKFDLSPALATQLRVEICRALAQHHAAALKRLEQVIASPDLATLSIRDLKGRAKEASIPGYWNMTKPELVAALAEVGSAHPTATLQADRA